MFLLYNEYVIDVSFFMLMSRELVLCNTSASTYNLRSPTLVFLIFCGVFWCFLSCVIRFVVFFVVGESIWGWYLN